MIHEYNHRGYNPFSLFILPPPLLSLRARTAILRCGSSFVLLVFLMLLQIHQFASPASWLALTRLGIKGLKPPLAPRKREPRLALERLLSQRPCSFVLFLKLTTNRTTFDLFHLCPLIRVACLHSTLNRA